MLLWKQGDPVTKKKVTKKQNSFKKQITSSDIKEDLNNKFTALLKQDCENGVLNQKITKLEEELAVFELANSHLFEKANKLVELGLVSTPSASFNLDKLRKKQLEYTSIKERLEAGIIKIKTIQQLHIKYSLKYPTFKFIDKKTMTSILTKYDLFIGDSQLYNKEIPTDSLEKIYQFKTEIGESTIHYELKFNSYSSRVTERIIKESTAESGYSMHLRDFTIVPINRSMEDQVIEFSSNSLKIAAPISHFKQITETCYSRYRDPIEVNILKFDKDTREISYDVTEFQEQLKTDIQVLDPIACLQVEGGYVIIDAWDEEAKIPEIQNPKLNN